MRYAILQRTPFPGYFCPIPRWQLNDAEYKLKFNRTHYHERAIQCGSLLLYTYEDARAIIAHEQVRYPFAEYMLIGDQIR